MPDRRTHIVCGHRFARVTGLKDVQVEVIETIIDHPSRAIPYLNDAAEKICAENPLSRECKILSTFLAGLRVRGVGAHDWNGKAAQSLLRSILETLWPGSSILVDLHNALDCLEQGNWQCEFTSEEVIEWAKSSCQIHRKTRRTH
ncbi:MAG: hypothetical protein F7C35_06730 [Desulfurococcales archaeon]|nr:hypothetical protein [Desulfurococcales archaeon]